MTQRGARVVDATGKACPMPILELARALRDLEIGQTLELLATDPAAEADLKAFCERTGHVLVSFSSDARILRAQVLRTH
ncbi:MAG: sulfurtransferase TusA family protein [Myxococcaceae bacterium]